MDPRKYFFFPENGGRTRNRFVLVHRPSIFNTFLNNLPKVFIFRPPSSFLAIIEVVIRKQETLADLSTALSLPGPQLVTSKHSNNLKGREEEVYFYFFKSRTFF